MNRAPHQLLGAYIIWMIYATNFGTGGAAYKSLHMDIYKSLHMDTYKSLHIFLVEIGHL